MSCAELERWLDEGMPAAGGADARAHAAGCARCARRLEAALAVDARLAEAAVSAPAGFTDAVMARVRAATEARGRSVYLALPDPFDWWVRAVAHPATALSLALAGLLLLGWDPVWRAAPGLARWLGALALPAPGSTASALQSALGDLRLQLCLLMGLAPAVTLLSLELYRWSERRSARPLTAAASRAV
jgi:hypothetical protein